jgi:hypothetical protein
MFNEHADAAGMSRARRALVAGLLALIGFALITVARPAAASANIPYPYEFMPHIDGYEQGDPQDSCDPTAKPGVVDFRNYLNFWFGQHTSYIVRECSAPGVSEHKEGRALDYMLPSTDPTSLKILANVLTSDKYGNAHALGRRFGLMYIISNRRIFEFDEANQGWQPYDGKNPHTDHIHFSFSWAGALRKTSWWTTTQQTRRACNSTIETWTFGSGFGPLVQVKKIQDAYGQTFDTQSEIRNSYWRVRAGGQQYFANQALSTLLNPRPQAVLPLFSGGTCAVNLT